MFFSLTTTQVLLLLNERNISKTLDFFIENFFVNIFLVSLLKLLNSLEQIIQASMFISMNFNKLKLVSIYFLKKL